MSRRYDSFRKELGKTCLVVFASALVAIFVTPRLTGASLALTDLAALIILAVAFFSFALFLLSDNASTTPDGRWHRVKVKKDTTIHIQPEQ